MPVAELGERRVYYEVHGTGEPVLLVNGLGADHSAWSLQTEYLKRFFQVMYHDIGLSRSYNVVPKQTINYEEKAVTVSLHFVPKR